MRTLICIALFLPLLARGAATFDGISQYATSVSTLDLTASPKLTIAFWYKWNSAYATDGKTIISSAASPTTTSGTFFIIPNSSDGKFQVGARGNSGLQQMSFTRPSAGVWHHIVVEYDFNITAVGTTVHEIVGAWLDGQAQVLGNIANVNNTGNFGNQTVYLANRGTGAFFAGCELDGLNIWSGVLLSADEIAQVFIARDVTTSTTVQAAALKLSWALNEALGPLFGVGSFLDQSGNGNTGTPFNSPVGTASLPYTPTTIHIASSPAFATVQAAWDISFPGDIITVGAGSNNWTGTLNCYSKPVSIIGAGTNSTTIAYNHSDTTPAINFRPIGIPAQIAGIYFVDITTAGPSINDGIIKANGNLYRIANNLFTLKKGTSIAAYGSGGSLIDHNHVEGSTSTDGAWVSTYRNGVHPINTNAFDTGITYGTTNRIYIEHNSAHFAVTDHGDGFNDAYDTVEFALRFNTITNTWINTHGTDTGTWRSPKSMEIYGNYLFQDAGGSSSMAYLFRFRGGSGVLFSNLSQKASGALVTEAAQLVLNRIADTSSDFAPWGYITGSNVIDGNTNSISGGYPPLDSPGWTGPTTFDGTHSTQQPAPWYAWSNTNSFGTFISLSAPVFTNIRGGGDNQDLIVNGRDFTNNVVLAGYTPLADPHPLYTYFLPGAFTFNTPADGATGIATTNVTLIWTASANALSYDIYFDTSSPPALSQSNWLGGTNYALTPLLPSTTYYVKIVANNLDGTATSTPNPSSFTTSGSVTPPQGGSSNPIRRRFRL